MGTSLLALLANPSVLLLGASLFSSVIGGVVVHLAKDPTGGLGTALFGAVVDLLAQQQTKAGHLQLADLLNFSPHVAAPVPSAGDKVTK